MRFVHTYWLAMFRAFDKRPAASHKHIPTVIINKPHLKYQPHMPKYILKASKKSIRNIQLLKTNTTSGNKNPYKIQKWLNSFPQFFQ